MLDQEPGASIPAVLIPVALQQRPVAPCECQACESMRLESSWIHLGFRSKAFPFCLSLFLSQGSHWCSLGKLEFANQMQSPV